MNVHSGHADRCASAQYGATLSLSPGQAVKSALPAEVLADPAPFDPTVYFGWLLGSPG